MLMAQADLDQVTARMTNGAVLLSGSARRIEVHSVDGDVVTRNAISVAESFSATTVNGDIRGGLQGHRTAHARRDHRQRRHPPCAAAPGPYVVNANTGEESGATVVRVPQTSDRKGAAAVVTARSDTGNIMIDELR